MKDSYIAAKERWARKMGGWSEDRFADRDAVPSGFGAI